MLNNKRELSGQDSQLFEAKKNPGGRGVILLRWYSLAQKPKVHFVYFVASLPPRVELIKTTQPTLHILHTKGKTENIEKQNNLIMFTLFSIKICL